ncbi:zeta toxin family protein [Nibrella viscosa]
MLGYYLNPDDIEKAVKRDGYYDVSGLNLPMSEPEIIDFFENHPLINRSEEADFVPAIRFVQEEFIDFANVGFNSYLSAILTDFLRQKLIEAGRSFTFETVMSSADKVQTLQKARDAGFRNYLYYVATEDPLINISRIRHRVRMGGHNVPDNKVVERYYRSLNLLLDAVRLTNRAYIFDNSGETKVWIAEITDGTDIELKTDLIPHWFTRAVLDKL